MKTGKSSSYKTYIYIHTYIYIYTHRHIYIYTHTYIYIYTHTYGFPGSSNGKEPTCNAGDPSSIPESGRYAGEGNSYPLQYSELYSPWSLKESDMTE